MLPWSNKLCILRLKALKIFDASRCLCHTVRVERFALNDHGKTVSLGVFHNVTDGCATLTERDAVAAASAVLQMNDVDTVCKTLKHGNGIKLRIEGPEGIDLKVNVGPSFNLGVNGGAIGLYLEFVRVVMENGALQDNIFPNTIFLYYGMRRPKQVYSTLRSLG